MWNSNRWFFFQRSATFDYVTFGCSIWIFTKGSCWVRN